MLASGIDYTIFFYNPNIHPKREYNLRKEENIRFAEKHKVPFVDVDYDPENWFARAKGMAHIARKTGLGRESLYKALSANGNPEFATVLKVIRALGLKLKVAA